MQIDVSERIETAKRLTREWSERAGYKQPPAEGELSKKANDLRRILSASAFGCQQRNVHALLEVLIDEKIPFPSGRALSEYAQREPFAVGSVLVPIHYDERAGMVVRTSGSGNAGLRKSSGEMHNNHYSQNDLRPATDEEIDAYFAEFFGLSVNPADAPAQPDEPLHYLETDTDGEIPF